MQRLLAIVINHAKNRVQFGRAISSYDSVYSMIVDMKVAIDAGRNLMFSVGRQIDDGHDASIEASVAKLFVSESYVNQARDAVQVFGAQATLREHAAINELLTAIPSTIYSGTSEIQRRIIAKSLGLF
jgi:alkylation response protein AidB-like acyl-CoA dehydrogenase